MPPAVWWSAVFIRGNSNTWQARLDSTSDYTDSLAPPPQFGGIAAPRIQEYIISLLRYSVIFMENRRFYLSHLKAYLAPSIAWLHWNFA